MAAGSEVPEHHVQQQLCTTRPAYRQGRELKAVKVYTVTQESRYLLIQGVPALGAGRELVKLCALYGAVEEYRALDDYPTADQFTDVYWVKFSRIQSARFAKRKLDNHSFFGGVLHVCYAPEYETVDDTRTKLQERRRVIANKTRQRQEQPPAARSGTEGVDDVNVIGDEEVTSSDSQRAEEAPRIPNQQTDHVNAAPVLPDSSIQPGNATRNPHPDAPFFTLHLPAPPHVMYAAGVPSQHLPQRFDHARVPSSHATLPHGYDPRAHNPVFHQLPPPGSVAGISRVNGNPGVSKKPEDTDSGATTHVNRHTVQLQNDSAIPGEQKVPKQSNVHRLQGGMAKIPRDLALKKGTADSQKVVVKEFKRLSAPPRFVPRQAEAALKRKGATNTAIETDDLSKEIRRNAVSLRATEQGPTLPDGRLRTLDVESPVDTSVKNTVTQIRHKLKQFSESGPQKKKLKPS